MLAALACVLTLSACGGSASQVQTTVPPPLSARSTKGTSASERPTALHLSGGDCAALAAQLGKRLGDAHVQPLAKPSPPLSRCRLSAPGVNVNVYLDTAYGAHQRYENRMDELVQFGAPDPAKVPHPVAGVGERSAYNHDASWIPAYDTLFAVRGNRWLTVAYAVAADSPEQLRAGAARIARLAFRLSAE